MEMPPNSEHEADDLAAPNRAVFAPQADSIETAYGTFHSDPRSRIRRVVPQMERYVRPEPETRTRQLRGLGKRALRSLKNEFIDMFFGDREGL